MASTIIFAISIVILAEAVGVLAYKVYKLHKELEETAISVDNLAECVLTLSKNTPKVEIIKPSVNKTTDFRFPNNEGF